MFGDERAQIKSPVRSQRSGCCRGRAHGDFGTPPKNAGNSPASRLPLKSRTRGCCRMSLGSWDWARCRRRHFRGA
ncbi:hypothetical protein KSP40_PGU022412 [Platanthera guangdongensis]|uniref:Uncharacterized protein n=1 Tax=Platanthera guangdongensis TaxID=2320717 RepID=A0ABR2N5N3_9ASPA